MSKPHAIQEIAPITGHSFQVRLFQRVQRLRSRRQRGTRINPWHAELWSDRALSRDDFYSRRRFAERPRQRLALYAELHFLRMAEHRRLISSRVGLYVSSTSGTRSSIRAANSNVLVVMTRSNPSHKLSRSTTRSDSSGWGLGIRIDEGTVDSGLARFSLCKVHDPSVVCVCLKLCAVTASVPVVAILHTRKQKSRRG